jgi:hypothetical protein
VAIQFDASTDQIIGPGWGGTVFTIGLWWYIDTDVNNFQNPLLIYANSGGAGSVRGGIGTAADGTSMTTFDSAFLTQSAGSPGTGVWYCTYLVGNGTSWTTYHGTNPGALTAVGPNTRTAVNAPGSIVLSLAAEWFRGRIAALKIWTRALSAVDVAAEAASYSVVDATSLIRSHTFQTVTMVPDAGGGGNLTAGSTATTQVAGPTVLDTGITGALAASIPLQTAAIPGDTINPGALAGAVPLQTAALAGDVVLDGALAGAVPLQTAALAGDTIDLGELATSIPLQTAALAGDVVVGGELAGAVPLQAVELAGELEAASEFAATIPLQTTALVGDVVLDGELAASIPLATAALRQTVEYAGRLRAGAPSLAAGLRAGAPVLAGGLRAGVPVLAGGLRAGEPAVNS